MGFPCAFTAIAVERDPLWNLAARAVAEFKSTSNLPAFSRTG